MITCKNISLILIFTSLIFLVHIAMMNHKSVQTYLAYTYPQDQLNTQNNYVIEGLKIQMLQELSTIPFIGNFFVQQLIQSLAINQKWSEVIFYSNMALNSIYHRNQFQIWYLKAKAECVSLKLEECRSSAYQAYMLSHRPYQNLRVQKLFKICNYRCKNCRKTEEQQLQIL